MWRRNSAPLPACAVTPILLPLWCSLPYKGRWRWALPALNRCSNAAVPMDDSNSEGLDELGAKLCQAQVTKHSILNTNHVQKLTSKGTSCKIWPLGSTGTWIIFTLVFYSPFINWLSGEIQNNIIQPLYCSIVKLTFSCFLIISTFILQQWQPIRIQKKKKVRGAYRVVFHQKSTALDSCQQHFMGIPGNRISPAKIINGERRWKLHL